MNINNKINKINKLIINNKELLNIKYKERNDLLEDNFKTKEEILILENEINSYIKSIELENEKLEKDLEEIKKLYDLNINIKKDKTQLCKYFKSPKGCDKNGNCSFAHGEIELKKFMKPCFSGLKCYKKDCYLKYSHPKGWNYKNNIIICEFFKNGYCINEDNCKFRHTKETDDDKNDEIIGNKIKENIINNDIEVNKNKEYQNDLKTNNYDHIKEIVNNHLHEDIIYRIIEDNKKKNSNCDIDNDDLSSNLKIIVDGKKYKNLETIFNNNNEINKVDFFNINSGIQEIEKENIDTGNISDDTIELISNFQDNFDKYIKEIKRNIDETFINVKEKDRIYLKFELNKIMSELLLFKNNFEDIINMKI
jgi:hypothetical protein